MALSEHERRMLEELEAQLHDEDPKFADALAPESGPTEWKFSPRHLVIGLLIAVLGLAIVLGGVATELIIVGVVGVIVVFIGFYYIAQGTTKVAVSASGRSAPKQGRSSFMDQQAQEWRKRREQGQ